ncbi:MAG: hypothetical protein IK123_00890, partial [Lachnospiraceae bacterium]|nr:hypothetical protein [Lachnospiraceae bacterium]
MKKRFKTTLALIVAVIMALSLVACGDKAEDADGGDAEVSEGAEAQSAEDGTPVCVGYWKYDDYPIYIVIASDLRWAAYDENGVSNYSGYIEE